MVTWIACGQHERAKPFLSLKIFYVPQISRMLDFRNVKAGFMVQPHFLIYQIILCMLWFVRSLKGVSSCRFHRGLTSIRLAQVISADTSGLQRAAQQLRSGGLVAFPTETVYGLGANALDASAVGRIFSAKGRPHSDPLIVHIWDHEDIHKLFDFSQADGPHALSVCELLVKTFWPGALTIIFKANDRIPSAVTAGTGFVGLRSPSHPIAGELLRMTGLPIAAPSANRFGHVSPTYAQHVLDDLGSCEDLLILDAPACALGIESTVCKVNPKGNEVEILRCGAVTASQMTKCLATLGHPVAVTVRNQRNVQHAAVAPGQMLKHYAADLPTFLVSGAVPMSLPAPHSLSTAVVIDFAGRLAHLRHDALAYTDLSSSGSAAEACEKVFAQLRLAEQTSDRATVLLLPDLRMLLDKKRDDVDLLHALWERLLRAGSGQYL